MPVEIRKARIYGQRKRWDDNAEYDDNGVEIAPATSSWPAGPWEKYTVYYLRSGGRIVDTALTKEMALQRKKELELREIAEILRLTLLIEILIWKLEKCPRLLKSKSIPSHRPGSIGLPLPNGWPISA